MVDYSAGTGQKSVSVYANISPDEALYLYSRIFSGVQTFSCPGRRYLGKQKEGYANVTKLMVSRYETDSAGKSGHIRGQSRSRTGLESKGKQQRGHTVKRIVLFRMELQKSFNGCGHVPHVFAGRGMDPGI